MEKSFKTRHKFKFKCNVETNDKLIIYKLIFLFNSQKYLLVYNYLYFNNLQRIFHFLYNYEKINIIDKVFTKYNLILRDVIVLIFCTII